MRISLPADLERYVARRVKSGHFGSEAEVIAQALRLLQAREKAEEERKDKVDRLVDEGLKDLSEGRASTRAQLREHSRQRRPR